MAVPAIAAIVMGGTQLYAGYEQGQAADRAAKLQEKRMAEDKSRYDQSMKDAEGQRKKYEADILAQQERTDFLNAADEASEDRTSARARQKNQAKGYMGRSDTFLTGPLGLVEEEKKGKTLLGT